MLKWHHLVKYALFFIIFNKQYKGDI